MYTIVVRAFVFFDDQILRVPLRRSGGEAWLVSSPIHIHPRIFLWVRSIAAHTKRTMESTQGKPSKGSLGGCWFHVLDSLVEELQAAVRPMQAHRLREEEPAQTREKTWELLCIITFSIHQAAIYGCGIEGRGQVVSCLDHKWP